jgi:hypothetical protein
MGCVLARLVMYIVLQDQSVVFASNLMGHVFSPFGHVNRHSSVVRAYLLYHSVHGQ